MKRIFVILMAMSMTASGLWAQIDVRSHAITASYMKFLQAHGAEMDEGFPIPSWNVEAHLAFMDEAGIETSILTMPAPQPWFGNGAESAAICRKYNEACAALKALYPGRFLFCASLPLPDVDANVSRLYFDLAGAATDDAMRALLTVTTADHQAYEAHIQTPHFRKYKDGTADMVRSLKLIDTMPLVMADFLKKAQ